jgi:hypothetical protein
MHVLTMLREFGLDPACDQARRAVSLAHDRVRWRGWDGATWRGTEWPGNPFFVGESEPCINWWHYDVLRDLEYLRRVGATPDERVAEAIALVESKRAGDGRWPLEIRYPGTMPIEIDEGEGRSSRWITLRALRVLRWYEGAK